MKTVKCYPEILSKHILICQPKSFPECRIMRNLGIMINWNSKLTEIKMWLFLWLEDGFWLALATIMLTDFFRRLAIQQLSVSRAYLLLLSMSEWVDLPWFLEEIEVIVLSHCNWTLLLHTACNIIQENTIQAFSDKRCTFTKNALVQKLYQYFLEGPFRINDIVRRRKFSNKLTFLPSWYAHLHTCSYQGMRNVSNPENFEYQLTQPAITCLKLIIETLEQDVKYVQS